MRQCSTAIARLAGALSLGLLTRAFCGRRRVMGTRVVWVALGVEKRGRKGKRGEGKKEREEG